jgi:hypothetical protein
MVFHVVQKEPNISGEHVASISKCKPNKKLAEEGMLLGFRLAHTLTNEMETLLQLGICTFHCHDCGYFKSNNMFLMHFVLPICASYLTNPFLILFEEFKLRNFLLFIISRLMFGNFFDIKIFSAYYALFLSI